MGIFQQLLDKYEKDNLVLGPDQLEELRDWLKNVNSNEICSADDAKRFVKLLRRFRETVERNSRLNGENYKQLLLELLASGNSGIYTDELRFIFELIQNVDDCRYTDKSDSELNMYFDWDNGKIILTYNETGFTPFNVFAITGIAEAAKNISDQKSEIGEKGIGFKSVFGVADIVQIRSGWFAFKLHKDNFTIPIQVEDINTFCPGTEMILYVPSGKVYSLYEKIRERYCKKDALFGQNPLLFLNNLTRLRMYYDGWRSMEFKVSRTIAVPVNGFSRDDDVTISVNLHDDKDRLDGKDKAITEIHCVRYTYEAKYDWEACRSRYGEKTLLGKGWAKEMLLQVVMPYPEYTSEVTTGTLYSFFPTLLKLPVPIACHVPFKLDPPREYLDTQNNNRWFELSCKYLSQLLDYAYIDWSKTVKADIVRYLPAASESLICKKNGKELCLSRQKEYMGAHFAGLSVFLGADGSYHTAAEITLFNQNENIPDPKYVYKLLDCKKALFIPPENTRMPYLGIEVLRDVHLKLFKLAMERPAHTDDILRYLDSVGYQYDDQVISQWDKFVLSPEQVTIICKHNTLYQAYLRLSQSCVKKNMRPNFFVNAENYQDVGQVLYEGFEASEAPDALEKYLTFCQRNCLLLDIAEDQCLPCYNAIVLPINNPLNAFIDLCDAVEPKNDFTIRWKLRKLSEKLSEIETDDSISDRDYLKKLNAARRNVKEALGSRGYGRYIDLIMHTASDKGRFVQELLQNADDCQFPDGVIPSFSISLRDSELTTECNENGFARKNVRALTAIGDSTKNQIISEARTIGEKGVGFKSVFAIASKAIITSGSFCFSLSDREPTIPAIVNQPAVTTKGTKMTFSLKDKRNILPLNEKAILELCLCLRKLKRINIGRYHVSIDDNDTMRTITIDRKVHSFKKFVHHFVIGNKEALRERENKNISDKQSITCYVPEKNEFSEYYLYAGLPTKHKMKIPMAIDAPYALTTSREDIEMDTLWNDIIRAEMYAAILAVIENLKSNERAKILRFTRFVPRRQGLATVYINDISDCGYLTSFDFLSLLRRIELLPTFDHSVFVTPQNMQANRYPDVANILFLKDEFGPVEPCTAIDLPGNEFDSVLNALGQNIAGFDKSFSVIEQYAESYIGDEVFRSKLYEYLQAAPQEYSERIKNLSVIPVYARLAGAVEYIAWKEESIYVKKGAAVSTPSYYILNEGLLSKSNCERIFGVNINEMNLEWERNRYNDQLRSLIRGTDTETIYQYLLSEYSKGVFTRYGSLDMLLGMKDLIPLKNQLGEITDTKLFLCNQPEGYLPVDIIRKLIVHRECAKFAAFIKCDQLSSIHYEDVDYYKQLTADDIETLMDDYFINREEILLGFYRDGLLSDELLEKDGLQFVAIGCSAEPEENYDFPDAPVQDLTQLKAHICKLWQHPTKVISKDVIRQVRFGQNSDGKTFDLDVNDAREGAIKTYTPTGTYGRCFCQMCNKVKPYGLIEVNSIEKSPNYYFAQMRIALCLECSKRFEVLRNNPTIREHFIDLIIRSIITTQGHIDIPIGNNEKVTFTATHLAEIQEILRNYPK